MVFKAQKSTWLLQSRFFYHKHNNIWMRWVFSCNPLRYISQCNLTHEKMSILHNTCHMKLCGQMYVCIKKMGVFVSYHYKSVQKRFGDLCRSGLLSNLNSEKMPSSYMLGLPELALYWFKFYLTDRKFER